MLHMKRFILFALTGCSAVHQAAMRAELAPLPLMEDHFARDQIGGVSEDALREILAAPVFLEEHARLGVVPVAAKYEPDEVTPVVGAPAELVSALEQTGMFENASEVSTEWPTERGMPGLRELAARYRSDYLLLYRHRFVEEVNHNGWSAGYATIFGALFFPGQQLEVAGVLEATLYDVKTGTVLFTALERIRDSDNTSPTLESRRMRELQRKMLAAAAPKLADQVVSKCRRLIASRPAAAPPIAERQSYTSER
jgi:hypothetical protein